MFERNPPSPAGSALSGAAGSVPLSVLTGDAALGLRRIAGPDAPGTPVHAVHTSEMADPVPYLLGGELLLSAGVHCPGDDGRTAQEHGRHWERYVARTVEAGAAALGFGIAPVHERVPPALARACDRHGLPLLEVPRSTTFTAVARAVSQALADRRHRELRRLSEAQQTLAAAAARPHPVRAVLGQLAQHLEAFAVLHGRGGRELATAGAPPPAPARAELAALTGRLRRPGPSSASAAHGELQLSVYGLGSTQGAASGGGREPLALGVCAPRRGGADAAVAGVAVVLLTLLTERRAAGTEEQRGAALVRLMLGASPQEAAPLLGEGAQAWTVVHGRRRGRPRTGERRGAGDPFETAALAAGLGTGLLDVTGDALRALLPGDGPVEAQPGWTLGAGPPVAVGELGRGDAEAARALRRALAQRRPLVRARPAAAAGVASLVAPEEARALAERTLAPLEGHPAVRETLRTWLSLHGGWDRTAVALGVHRNTVRQRIARAGALLGLDLTEQDARMELWFALKWR